MDILNYLSKCWMVLELGSHLVHESC